MRATQASSIRSLVAELRELVETLKPGVLLWDVLLPALSVALRAETPLAYGYDTMAEVPFVSYFRWNRPHLTSLAVATMNRAHAEDGGWGLFDPREPEPKQRNRAVTLADLGVGIGKIPERFQYRKVQLDQLDQLRVLVCEGSSLQAWVGAYRGDAFTPGETRILQAIVRPLSARLSLELDLTNVPLLKLSLAACMEMIPGPAVLLDRHGRIRHANEQGIRRIESSNFDRNLFAEIAAGRPTPGVTVTRIDDGAGRRSLLVTLPPDVSPREALVHRAAVAWSLTPRERQVLGLLVRGFSNRATAANLRCSLRNIEVLVTRLLKKSSALSRTDLVVRVLSAEL